MHDIEEGSILARFLKSLNRIFWFRVFSPSFFTSIFHWFFSRFWWGLGGVLGSQKALKIDIWGVLGAMLFETLFSTICPSIFVKIDGEKRQDVWWNFHMSSHDLFVERHVFHKAGNPENIDFPWGKCIFLQNLIFRVRCKQVAKIIQKAMDWEGEWVP